MDKDKIEEIDVNSEEFKAGYRQGYIDGMDAMADRILAKLRKAGTDDGK